MTKEEKLGNLEVRLITGFTPCHTSKFLSFYGTRVGGRYYIEREKMQELMQSGAVENFRDWKHRDKTEERELRERFCTRLKKCMKESHIGVRKFCAELRITPQMLEIYLNKSGLPSTYTLYKIAAFFGKTMDEMIGEKKDEHDA